MYYPGMRFKHAITFDHTKVTADVTGVSIVLTRDNLHPDLLTTGNSKAAKSDGGDIRLFSDSSLDTRIPFDIIHFAQNATPSSAVAEIVVKTNLSSSTDTVIYIGWGDSSMSLLSRTDTYGRNNAYDSNFKLWCPMKDGTTSTVTDRTVNDNNGTKLSANNPPETTGGYGTAGYCNQYQNFDGSDDKIDFPTISHGTSFTVFAPFASDKAGVTIYNTKATQNAATGFCIISPTANTDRIWIWGANSTYDGSQCFTNVTTDGWETFACKVAGTDFSAFVNGTKYSKLGSGIESVSASSNQGQVGYNSFFSFYSDGKFDNVILYNGSLSDDVIKTMQNNQRASWDFADYGTITSLPQTVSATGIASAGAFGTPQINLKINLNGIASAGAFGQPTITQQQSIINLNSINSAEAFGSASVKQTIHVSGIASSEAFGTPSISTIQPAGIVSGEAFGAPAISLKVLPAGIASGEALGLPVVGQRIEMASVPSAEAFGTPEVEQLIHPMGIGSGEAFGTPILTQKIQLNGVASAEAFGAPVIGQNILPYGIASGEAFGNLSVSTIQPNGIASSEAFGTPAVGLIVSAISVSSAEAFGTPVIDLAIAPNSINSAEAFGSASVKQTIHVSGIASSEAFGTPSISTIQPAGIVSGEAFGAPAISLKVLPAGIASGEALGLPVVGQRIEMASVPSAEAFGTPEVEQLIHPMGIGSGEAFGTPKISFMIFVQAIGSGEAFGWPSILSGIIVHPNGVLSGGTVGTPLVKYNQAVILTGIATAQAIGAPAVVLRVLNEFQQLLEDDFAKTFFNTKEFAETAEYVPLHGAAFNIDGIFDNEYVAVQPDTGVAVQTSGPVFWTHTTKYARRPVQGDKLRIRGSLFNIVTSEPDGTGVTVFILHRHRTI